MRYFAPSWKGAGAEGVGFIPHPCATSHALSETFVTSKAAVGAEGSVTAILSMAQPGSFSRELFQGARWSWAGSPAPDTFRFAL